MKNQIQLKPPPSEIFSKKGNMKSYLEEEKQKISQLKTKLLDYKKLHKDQHEQIYDLIKKQNDQKEKQQQQQIKLSKTLQRQSQLKLKESKIDQKYALLRQQIRYNNNTNSPNSNNNSTLKSRVQQEDSKKNSFLQQLPPLEQVTSKEKNRFYSPRNQKIENYNSERKNSEQVSEDLESKRPTPYIYQSPKKSQLFKQKRRLEQDIHRYFYAQRHFNMREMVEDAPEENIDDDYVVKKKKIKKRFEKIQQLNSKNNDSDIEEDDDEQEVLIQNRKNNISKRSDNKASSPRNLNNESLDTVNSYYQKTDIEGNEDLNSRLNDSVHESQQQLNNNDIINCRYQSGKKRNQYKIANTQQQLQKQVLQQSAKQKKEQQINSGDPLNNSISGNFTVNNDTVESIEFENENIQEDQFNQQLKVYQKNQAILQKRNEMVITKIPSKFLKKIDGSELIKGNEFLETYLRERNKNITISNSNSYNSNIVNFQTQP